MTTKPHRDGAPDESLLMLGYEPSAIASEVTLSDWPQTAPLKRGNHSRAVMDNLTMFKSGQLVLEQCAAR